MTIRDFGIYPDLSNELYHADKNYVSRSGLLDFDRSPLTFWANHINPDRPKKEPTPAMELGSALHALILEPKTFDKEYAVLPPKFLLKDVGRDLYEKCKKTTEEMQQSGKILLSEDEYQKLQDIEERFNRNWRAMELIEGARIEHSLFWQDEHSKMLVKCRPDAMQDNMIVDLKTCADASPRAFQNAMVQGGFHIQFAMMRDAIRILEGREIKSFINICIETKYPYNMAIYIIDEDAIEAGHMKYKNLLLDLKNAKFENKWPDFGIQQISLPRWAI